MTRAHAPRQENTGGGGVPRDRLDPVDPMVYQAVMGDQASFEALLAARSQLDGRGTMGIGGRVGDAPTEPFQSLFNRPATAPAARGRNLDGTLI